MHNSEDSLKALRAESQELYRNIVALFSDGKANAEAELEKMQAKVREFGETLKQRAATEQGAIKARMNEAGAILDAERSKINESVNASVEAGMQKMDQAKSRLLDGMTAATRSLSEAVAAQRTGAIPPNTPTKME
jgi:hypothetical protein